MRRCDSPSHAARGRLPAALAAISALCIAASACGGTDPASGAHADAFPRLVAEAGMRIGDFDDPDLGFSRVGGVDVDRDGNIYVVEALVPEIRVYGPDGTLVRRIGRRGAGPGEFEDAPLFGIFGDTVWALTYGPDRITLFDRRGTVLSARNVETVAVPLPGASYGYVLPRMMRPDGKFRSHLTRVGYNRNNPPTGVQPTDSIPVPFVLFEATGAVADTIGWAPRPPPQMWRPPSERGPGFEFIQVGGRRLMVPRAPTALARRLPLPDGYLAVEAPLPQTPEDGVFTVTRMGFAGDTVYTRAIHYRPLRYSEADLDSIAVHAARGEAGGMVLALVNNGPPPDDWEAIAHRLRAAMDFPEFQPPIERPWLAQDGSLWLRLRGEAGPTARWLVLDPLGEPRGVLELPSDLGIRWSRGDVFWAVDPDESDVPWVVRYKIQPAGS